MFGDMLETSDMLEMRQYNFNWSASFVTGGVDDLSFIYSFIYNKKYWP